MPSEPSFIFYHAVVGALEAVLMGNEEPDVIIVRFEGRWYLKTLLIEPLVEIISLLELSCTQFDAISQNIDFQHFC